MTKRILMGIAASTFILSTLSNAQDDLGGTEDEGISSQRKPYEIVITPTITRARLRDLIVDVEDDFFSRFNELNIDDNYDIVCYKHTPIMSHISQRVCEPLFLWRARGANSSDVTFLLGSGGKDAINQASQAAAVVTPGAMRIDKKKDFEVLQEKMEELNRTDEELRSIGSVLAQLKARLAGIGQDD